MTVNDITRYLSYLSEHHHLSVSVHFRAERSSMLPQDVFFSLLPYNTHTNLYCMEVKRCHRNACLASQREVYEGEASPYFRVCHAGVSEYISPLTLEGDVIGFVAVSGYRKGGCPASLPQGLWESALSDAPFPLSLVETLIPPLSCMLEGLFAKYAHREADEFGRIAAFLAEDHTTVSLDALCRQFHRSRSYISHLFNERAGCSLRTYCNQLKLADAERLLDTTTLSVTEIAYTAGFGDASYFIKLFKEKYGVSPKQYKMG